MREISNNWSAIYVYKRWLQSGERCCWTQSRTHTATEPSGYSAGVYLSFFAASVLPSAWKISRLTMHHGTVRCKCSTNTCCKVQIQYKYYAQSGVQHSVVYYKYSAVLYSTRSKQYSWLLFEQRLDEDFHSLWSQSVVHSF